MDTAFRPLDPVWSCAHLEVAGQPGRAYARCRLGGAGERLAWAGRIRADRLESWRAVAREFGVALMEPLAEVYSAKARQVEAMGTPAAPEAGLELRRRVEDFLARDFELMDLRASELEEIGFPVEAMKVATRDAVEALVARPRVYGGYEPPADLLALFSADIADFVRGLFTSPSR